MSAKEQQPVLVIGAGELGREIIYSLSQHPQRRDTLISVLLRQSTIDTTEPEKRAFLEDLQTRHGITLVVGDIDKDDKTALCSIFKQYHTIIGASGMVQASGTQTKLSEAVIAAAESSDGKTKRYVPWQFGLDYDAIGPGSAQGLFTEQLAIREMLKRDQDKLDWVIISTGIFTTFLFEDAFGVVQVRRDGDAQQSTVRALGSWDNTVTYTTPRDIGRLTAEVVLAAPEIKSQVVFVAGDTVSFAGIKTAVEKALQREVQGQELGIDVLKQKLADDPDNGLLKYSVVLAEGVGVAWGKHQTFNAQRGIETQTVEQFAAAVLRQ